MTGPEHYIEAENALRLIAIPNNGASGDEIMMLIGIAQVHATLAQAAAYGTQCGDMSVVEPIGDKWREVAS